MEKEKMKQLKALQAQMRQEEKQKEKEATSTPSSSWENPYETEEIDPVIYFGGKPYVHKKNIETVLFI